MLGHCIYSMCSELYCTKTDLLIVQYRHYYVLFYCIYVAVSDTVRYAAIADITVSDSVLLVLITMCSCIETFNYYYTEICDLLLSLFLLYSIDYYV